MIIIKNITDADNWRTLDVIFTPSTYDPSVFPATLSTGTAIECAENDLFWPLNFEPFSVARNDHYAVYTAPFDKVDAFDFIIAETVAAAGDTDDWRKEAAQKELAEARKQYDKNTNPKNEGK